MSSEDGGGSTPGIEQQSAARRVLGVESVVISGTAMGTSQQSMRLSLRTFVSGVFDGALDHIHTPSSVQVAANTLWLCVRLWAVIEL